MVTYPTRPVWDELPFAGVRADHVALAISPSTTTSEREIAMNDDDEDTG